MKDSNSKLLWYCFALLLLVGANHAAAQTAQAVPWVGGGEVALGGKLVGICVKAAGLAAAIGAGVRSRGKDRAGNGVATLVGAVGGLWTAYAWLGWPFATFTQTKYGWLGLTSWPEEVSEFSFARLLGMGLFALLGIGVCNLFSNQGQKGN
jgi:hypothetical protein